MNYIRTFDRSNRVCAMGLQELSTRIGRRPAVVPYKITDYVVGKFLVEAEAAGEVLEIIHPMIIGSSGLEVEDWTGLEAIMYVCCFLLLLFLFYLFTFLFRVSSMTNKISLFRRYIFHVALLLPRPPLAHPVALSLPPHLPPLLVDTFHSLLFERLLIPQLLVASRPFFAAAAAGVVNAVVLDIGARGEGSEVSVVNESQIYDSATARFNLDEGNLDDWVSLQLLLENPSLPQSLSPETELSQEELLLALRMIIASLKEGDVIGFSNSLAGSGVRAEEPMEDDGNFDVAKVIVEGRVDKIIGKKDKKGKEKREEEEEEGDFVDVPHPLNSDLEPLKIGPSRHRYLEPLFTPSILSELAPSSSSTAKLLGLSEYEGREISYSGVAEIIGIAVEQAVDPEVRRAAYEAVMIISTGKIARIQG